MTLADAKRIAEQVLLLPDGATGLEAYKATQALHGAMGRVLANMREGMSAEERAAFKLMLRATCGAPRKHPGTGAYDTPEETWEQMRIASLAGESLASLARRFGVLYSAIQIRRSMDRRRGLWWLVDRTNVIPFPANRKTHARVTG